MAFMQTYKTPGQWRSLAGREGIFWRQGWHVQRPRGRMCSAGGEQEEKAKWLLWNQGQGGWGLTDSPSPRGGSQQMVSPGSMDASEGSDQVGGGGGRESAPVPTGPAEGTSGGGDESPGRCPCLVPGQLKPGEVPGLGNLQLPLV